MSLCIKKDRMFCLQSEQVIFFKVARKPPFSVNWRGFRNDGDRPQKRAMVRLFDHLMEHV